MPQTAAPAGVLAAALRLAVVRLNRRLRAQRAHTSVSLTQLAAMSTLDHHGPLSPGELAAYERVQPPSMTRVLAALEQQGLVVRRPHPTDGRQVIVELSPAGQQLCHDEIRLREAWLCRRVSELTPADREVLRKAVEVINRMVEQE